MEDKSIEQLRITHGMILVRQIAKHIHIRMSHLIELDELVQWDSFGLLHAIKKYESNRNTTFKTYATYRIRGAMFDGLRDQDATSRSARTHGRAIEGAMNDFYLNHGRMPAETELASKLNIDVSTLRKTEARTVPIKAISYGNMELFSKDDKRALIVSLKNKKTCVSRQFEIMEELKNAIHDNDPIRRACFLLLNIWGFTLKEMADLFGVSESRISQLIKTVKLVALEGGNCEL